MARLALWSRRPHPDVIGALVSRVVQAAVVAALVAAIAFFVLHAAPGDPLSALIENPAVSPEMVAAERVRLGYDKPAAVQFVAYLSAAMQYLSASPRASRSA